MTFLDKFSQWARESIALKLFVIGFLILMLMIPIAMVESLIYERGTNKKNVANQIYADWSGSQTLQGPILTVPYYDYYWYTYDHKDSNGNTTTKKELKKNIEYAHFLPSKLGIEGSITPYIRYRSIYEAVVYKSDLRIHGTFNKPDMSEWRIESKDILYDMASISFGISDLRGVQDRIKMQFDDKEYFFNPGIKSSEVSMAIDNGISVPVLLDKNKQNIAFDFNLKLNGSESLFFLPYGKESIVNLKSTWSNPSFAGDFLPDSREINEDGFTAKWKVIDINRAYPQNFKGTDIKRLKNVKGNRFVGKYDYSESNRNHQGSSFGVNLKVPVDYYQKSSRSVKYGILIIILTFISFFFVEIFIKKRIHAFQYILVGFSLVLFFALLISFSEHIGFDFAYLISSIVTILAITLYSKSIFKNQKFVRILFGIISLFYAFIYLLLQLQDYSLILGTVMLFVVLSIIMYVSRDIDWYNIKKDVISSNDDEK